MGLVGRDSEREALFTAAGLTLAATIPTAGLVTLMELELA
jgi:hypothetical protein